MASEWKIWYGDGSTFSSENGLPGDAPTTDVQAIAERRAGRAIVLVYGEVYCWTSGGWTCASTIKSDWPPAAPVLHGGLIPFKKFRSMKTKAVNWSIKGLPRN